MSASNENRKANERAVVKHFVRKVHVSANRVFAPSCNSNRSRRDITRATWHQNCRLLLRMPRRDARKPVLSPRPPMWGSFVRRSDLLKPDLLSDIVLLGAGALIFALLVLIVV